MIPNENIHRIAAFLAAIAATWLVRHYNLVIETEWLTTVFVGVFAFVESIVGKYTNPTGANAALARRALESVVVQEVRAAQVRAAGRPDEYVAAKTVNHDKE